MILLIVFSIHKPVILSVPTEENSSFARSKHENFLKDHIFPPSLFLIINWFPSKLSLSFQTYFYASILL